MVDINQIRVRRDRTETPRQEIDYSFITRDVVRELIGLPKQLELDLFSAATAPSTPTSSAPVTSKPQIGSAPSHGGYPSTSTAPLPLNGAGTTIASGGGVTAASWPFGGGVFSNPVTYTLSSISADEVTYDSKMTSELPPYSFKFTEDGVSRKATLEPEYDLTSLETLKLVRMMTHTMLNFDNIQFVKDNNLLRHFRLE